jgi:DNA-binding CsgD family transcriptional regulator
MRPLSQRDVSALLRLSGEVGELPRDTQVRRARILEGLLALVGGIHAQCSEADIASPARYGLALPDTTTQVGTMDDGQLAAMATYLSSDQPARDPCVPFMLQAKGEVVVRRREEMVDRSWYRSDHYNLFRRAVGAGESLYCHVRTRGRYFRIGIIREPRDRAYSDRDVQVMKLFHENLASVYLVGPSSTAEATTRADDPGLPTIPPRLRPVLHCLLQGDAEKQIARKLGLSRHTVHEYAKILYRTLAVTTRGELLARFIPSQIAQGQTLLPS